MENKNYRKMMHWMMVCLIAFSMILGNVMPVYAAGESVKRAAETATYAASEDEDDGDEDEDEDDGDEDDGDEDDGDEDDGDEDDGDEDDGDEDDGDEDEDDGDEDDGDEDDGDEDENKEPEEVNFVRVASVDYNTNNGTTPVYSAKVADGGAAVAFEGWEGSDNTKSYNTYAAYGDADDIFETFTEGVAYTYNMRIAAKKGYIFADEVQVQMGERTYFVNPNGNKKMITIRGIYTKVSECVHVWINKVKKPTCVEGGYTTHTCKYCQRCYTDTYVPAGGHKWVMDPDDIETADEEDDGEILYTCKNCDEERTEVIPKIKSVTLSKTKYTYSGAEKKPSATVLDRKGNVISKSYYTIKYSGNKNAGTGKATLIFKNRYDTEIEKKFTIAQASQKISAKVSSKTYKKATVAKKAQSFSIGAAAKTSLSYKSNSKNVTVSSKGSVNVKKGAPAGTYKVTVSAKKSTNYKAASKTVTVKVS